MKVSTIRAYEQCPYCKEFSYFIVNMKTPCTLENTQDLHITECEECEESFVISISLQINSKSYQIAFNREKENE